MQLLSHRVALLEVVDSEGGPARARAPVGRCDLALGSTPVDSLQQVLPLFHTEARGRRGGQRCITRGCLGSVEVL